MHRHFLFTVLFFSAVSAFAQLQIVNNVELATKTGNTVSRPVLSKAKIAVLDETQQFRAAIELFPIVPTPDALDSLEQVRRPLTLYLVGNFPIKNLDFISTGDNGKQYIMSVTARINDSTQKIPLNFALLVRRNEPVDPNGNLEQYNTRINFSLLLPPDLFGLNVAPFEINQLILVQCSGAVIVKQDIF